LQKEKKSSPSPSPSPLSFPHRSRRARLAFSQLDESASGIPGIVPSRVAGNEGGDERGESRTREQGALLMTRRLEQRRAFGVNTPCSSMTRCRTMLRRSHADHPPSNRDRSRASRKVRRGSSARISHNSPLTRSSEEQHRVNPKEGGRQGRGVPRR
jgi:hypothetical protein